MRSVSYTHLDVYKRQDYDLANPNMTLRLWYTPGDDWDVYHLLGLWTDADTSQQTVSYTHLCGTASALPKCSIMSGCGTRIVHRGQKPLALCEDVYKRQDQDLDTTGLTRPQMTKWRCRRAAPLRTKMC